jgi:hypothetical protein
MNSFERLQERMVFSTTESIKTRLVVGIAAILPLLAPYQLLIKPVWTEVPSIARLFAVVISLGAIAVSVLLFLIATFGINRQVEFNAADKTIRVTESHLMQRKGRFEHSFDGVKQIEVICHDWSDGPSTYKLRLTPHSGRSFDFGDFSTRTDAKSVHSSLCTLLGRSL